MSCTILTADDSKMVRMIVARAFKSFDCQIVEAADGKQALEAAQQQPFDLILLDITMPELTGLEVLEKLRENPSTQSVPVIMLTAESGNATLEKADSLNVSGYIAKPFKEEQLIEEASKVIELPVNA